MSIFRKKLVLFRYGRCCREAKTNLAIKAMYVFHPVIFKALEATKSGKNGEIQLTDAIQKSLTED